MGPTSKCFRFVNGTFSSYAWSILVINHLQEQGVIPNLQVGEDRTLIEIAGKEFDITVNEDATLADTSQQNIAELTMSFYRNYATRNWENEVISIRNGRSISRDEKGWMNEEPTALEIYNSDKENPGRMGEHHLAIEDPFETDHDLCRVVRAEGELRIRNELLRAAELFGNGSTWKEICETVDSDRLKDLEPLDIFYDLRDKNDDLVRNMLEKTKAEIDAVDRRIDALESERQSTLRMAKAMRGVIEETSRLEEGTQSDH